MRFIFDLYISFIKHSKNLYFIIGHSYFQQMLQDVWLNLIIPRHIHSNKYFEFLRSCKIYMAKYKILLF